MFEKLKQLKRIKELQESIQKERFEVEKNGVKTAINGGFVVEEVCLNPELTKEEQERLLKSCLNEAMQKVHLTIAKKFSEMS